MSDSRIEPPTVVTDFPHSVREIENMWMPMPDGARLGMRLWLPADADEDRPVPVIFEQIPYRKRDFTRRRDAPMHHWFAGHGYAVVRLDMRGSGDSDGVMADEFLEQELQDGRDAVEWLARQPWCTGKVGMMGISWGGFSGLQVATLRPQGLEAVISACSSDDRYTDDMHYMGGSPLSYNLDWGTAFMAFRHRPPDPEIVGDRWREMWRERLEIDEFPLETWFRHQRRDDYWKRGSAAEHLDRIDCPVFLVGGWMDGYSNAVPRMLERLTCPRLGLVGPWAHKFPQVGVPGPAIGFLQEALRWWDHWLKGRETGITDEPMYRVWMQEELPARSWYAQCPGRWVAEPAWPAPSIQPTRLYLDRRGLSRDPVAEARLDHRSPQTVGEAAGEWCAYGIGGAGPQFPGDQRADDGRSLSFETDPLEERLEILGAPVVRLDLAVDQPVALVAVRLNDVHPDGSVARVTYGVLNLTHRDGHEAPERVEPGERITVRVPLNDIAYAFAAGHRVRVAISTAYWPIVWPSPAATTLSLFLGTSRIELPVRPARPDDEAIAFGGPEVASPVPVTTIEPARFSRTTCVDAATGVSTIIASDDDGVYRIEEVGLDVGWWSGGRTAIGADDPLSARAERSNVVIYRRGGWSVRVEVRTSLAATGDLWLLHGDVTAYEGEEKIFDKQWDRAVPRDLA